MGESIEGGGMKDDELLTAFKDDELLTSKEVSQICGITMSTLSNWIAGRRPSFPKGFKLGRGKGAHRRWMGMDIREWLNLPFEIVDGERISLIDSFCGPVISSDQLELNKCKRMEPDGGLHQLYRHYSKNEDLLYIGISLSAAGRLAAHKNSSHWYRDIATVRIENFPSRAAVVIAERIAISRERPKHNIMLKAA